MHLDEDGLSVHVGLLSLGGVDNLDLRLSNGSLHLDLVLDGSNVLLGSEDLDQDSRVS